MKNLFVISMVIMAICVVGIHGATISDSDSTTSASTDWSDSWVVDKFDSDLGTLTSIRIQVNTNIETTITVTNNDANPTGNPSSGSAKTEFGLQLSRPSGTNPFTLAGLVGAFQVQAKTSTQDVDGLFGPLTSSPAVIGPLTVNTPNTRDITINSGTFFTEAQASGGGLLTFDVQTRTGSTVSFSGGNTAATQVTTGAADIVITYTYTAIVSGDPQFIGFQSQRFQVHGIPDEHFNLISTPQYYVNSHFVYMANGVCNYNDTECFSHAGTYINQLGFVMGDAKLKIIAGSHAEGLKAYINDQHLSTGARIRLSTSNDSYVHMISHSKVRVVLPDVTILVTNSDNFFNLGADFTNAPLFQAGAKKIKIQTDNAKDADILLSTSYPEYLMHGLLGQTWRNIEWPHMKLYQGEATDYQVANLFSSEFVYTQYIAPQTQA